MILTKRGVFYYSPFLVFSALVLRALFIIPQNFTYAETSLLIAVSLSPGYYYVATLPTKLGVRQHERVLLSIVISLCLILFSGVYSAQYFKVVNARSVLSILWILTIPAILLKKTKGIPTTRNEHLETIIMITVFFLSLLSFTFFLPESYWRGWDPWIYKPLGESIMSEGLSPAKLRDQWSHLVDLPLSGFFYLIASIHVVTKLSFYSLIRNSAPIMAGLMASGLYMLGKRLLNRLGGVLFPLFYLLSPFVVHRVSTPLRENFVLILLICFIWYLEILRESEEMEIKSLDRGFLVGVSLVTGMLFSHPLIHIMFIIFIVVYSFYNLKNEKHNVAKFFGGISFVSMLIASPTSIIFYFTLLNYLIYKISIYLILLGIISIVLLLYWENLLKLFSSTLFSKISLLSILIGALYAITIYQYRITGFQYMDYHLAKIHTYFTINQFSVTTLILSAVYIVKYRKSISPILNSFIIGILMIINLNYVFYSIPYFRLALYAAIYFSYIACKYVTEEINAYIETSGKSIKNMLLITVLLFSGITVDLINISTINRNSNYNSRDIYEAEILYSKYPNITVFPSYKTRNLLTYIGYDVDQIIGHRERDIYLNISDSALLWYELNVNHPEIEVVGYFALNYAGFITEEFGSPFVGLLEEKGVRENRTRSRIYILDVSSLFNTSN